MSVDLSICIPAYREAENLTILLPTIKHAAAALTPNFEVLIIDTQQPLDNTADICAANAVRHIPRTGGNSFGDAVRTILREARGQYILCLDADCSHNPAYFAALWAERNRYDIVIGSRYTTGGQTENPAILVFMSYVLNLIFRIAFSIRAKDISNSFRLYHRDTLTPLHLQSNDFDIVEEVLIKASILNPHLRIGEVPITFGRRKAGESKRNLLQFAFSYLATIRRMRSFTRAAKSSLATPKESISQ